LLLARGENKNLFKNYLFYLEENMSNKIGVMSTTYAHYKLEDALSGIANGGFKYVELASIIFPGCIYNDHVFIDSGDIKKSVKLCKEYGVSIIAICFHGRLMKENAIENFKKCIDVADILEVGNVSSGTGEVKTEEDEKRFYEEISLLGEYASGKHINIFLEIHDSWFCNGKAADKIIKKIGLKNIKINYDTANVIYYGDTRPENDIKYTLPNLGHVHLKDKRGGYKIYDFPALGEGEIDFKDIFKTLKNYDGPMCVEIELDGSKHSLDELDEAVKKSFDFLKGFGLV
jgi:L-ribulose-5-phosphate 3-epimerase